MRHEDDALAHLMDDINNHGKDAVGRRLKRIKKQIQSPRFRFVVLLPKELPPRLRTYAPPRISARPGR